VLKQCVRCRLPFSFIQKTPPFIKLKHFPQLQLQRVASLDSSSESERPRAIVIEGLDVADPGWVLLDASDILVHVQTAEARQTWDIEAIWNNPEEWGDDEDDSSQLSPRAPHTNNGVIAGGRGAMQNDW